MSETYGLGAGIEPEARAKRSLLVGQASVRMKRFEASGVLLIKVTAAAVSYIFVLLLARMMTPADFGIVGALLTGSLLLSVMGMMGQHTGLLRFIPPMRKLQGDDAVQTRNMINRAFTLGLIGMMALTVVLAGALLLADSIGLRAVPWPVMAGLALITLVGWIDMQAHLARAWRSVVLALVPKEILWRAFVLAGAGATYWWGGGADLALGTVVALMIGVLVVLIMGQGALMGRTMPRPKLDPATLRDTPEDWRRTVVPFWINGVASMFLTNADVVIVALVLGGEPAAYYFAANRVAMLCRFFLMSHNIVVGPKVSAIWFAGDRSKVQRIIAKSALQAFLPTAITAALIAGFSGFILALFGSEFVQTESTLLLLLLSATINAAFGPVLTVLNMCGEERFLMMTNIWMIFCSTVLLIAGALLSGAFGVAMAVLVANAAQKFLAVLILYRKHGLSTTIFTFFRRAS